MSFPNGGTMLPGTHEATAWTELGANEVPLSDEAVREFAEGLITRFAKRVASHSQPAIVFASQHARMRDAANAFRCYLIRGSQSAGVERINSLKRHMNTTMSDFNDPDGIVASVRKDHEVEWATLTAQLTRSFGTLDRIMAEHPMSMAH